MMAMIVPGQAVFLFCIYMMQGGHQSMTALFISLYMMCSVGIGNFQSSSPNKFPRCGSL